MINQLIYSKKYRPKNLNEIILLPRIREVFKDNVVSKNYLFYGSSGCGKSSLANILCDARPNIKINASLYTSVELLRNEVLKFCTTMSMFDSADSIKIVYLDEFEKISSNAMDALKGFMEDDDLIENVRFIATTNHISKVSDGILSRFVSIDFDPKTAEEKAFLKNEYIKKLYFLSKQENVDLSKEQAIKLVNHNFPDLRQITLILQHIKETGQYDYESKIFNLELKEQLFDNILNKVDTFKTMEFVLENFPPEKIIDLVYLLGRPFIEFLSKKDGGKYIPSLERIVIKVAQYNHTLQSSSDPIVHGVALIEDVKKSLFII